ncbi:hypothetical protein C496_08034 [Natronorubrum tibetense GA33]|uniref:Uncharacterized protein n=1 Tax=Natronorubrum tibetense GA33 TaxID=1114856 RepID=L9VYB0_9EURY|nr:hypothetical protein C496_08034 [Natronorubrum tibetense GA33]
MIRGRWAVTRGRVTVSSGSVPFAFLIHAKTVRAVYYSQNKRLHHAHPLVRGSAVGESAVQKVRVDIADSGLYWC